MNFKLCKFVDAALLYNDGSFLLNSFLPNGTLLDLANRARQVGDDSFGVARVESIVELGKRVSSSGLSQRLGPALMTVDAAFYNDGNFLLNSFLPNGTLLDLANRARQVGDDSFGVARVESIVELGKRVSSSGLSQRLGPALMSVDAAFYNDGSFLLNSFLPNGTLLDLANRARQVGDDSFGVARVESIVEVGKRVSSSGLSQRLGPALMSVDAAFYNDGSFLLNSFLPNGTLLYLANRARQVGDDSFGVARVESIVEVGKRVSSSGLSQRLGPALMSVDAAFYNDGSFLLNSFLPNGTLLDLANRARQVGDDSFGVARVESIVEVGKRVSSSGLSQRLGPTLMFVDAAFYNDGSFLLNSFLPNGTLLDLANRARQVGDDSFGVARVESIVEVGMRVSSSGLSQRLGPALMSVDAAFYNDGSFLLNSFLPDGTLLDLAYRARQVGDDSFGVARVESIVELGKRVSSSGLSQRLGPALMSVDAAFYNDGSFLLNYFLPNGTLLDLANRARQVGDDSFGVARVESIVEVGKRVSSSGLSQRLGPTLMFVDAAFYNDGSFLLNSFLPNGTLLDLANRARQVGDDSFGVARVESIVEVGKRVSSSGLSQRLGPALMSVDAAFYNDGSFLLNSFLPNGTLLYLANRARQVGDDSFGVARVESIVEVGKRVSSSGLSQRLGPALMSVDAAFYNDGSFLLNSFLPNGTLLDLANRARQVGDDSFGVARVESIVEVGKRVSSSGLSQRLGPTLMFVDAAFYNDGSFLLNSFLPNGTLLDLANRARQVGDDSFGVARVESIVEVGMRVSSSGLSQRLGPALMSVDAAFYNDGSFLLNSFLPDGTLLDLAYRARQVGDDSFGVARVESIVEVGKRVSSSGLSQRLGPALISVDAVFYSDGSFLLNSFLPNGTLLDLANRARQVGDDSFGVARVESIVEVGKRVSSSGLSQRLGPALISVDAAFYNDGSFLLNSFLPNGTLLDLANRARQVGDDSFGVARVESIVEVGKRVSSSGLSQRLGPALISLDAAFYSDGSFLLNSFLPNVTLLDLANRARQVGDDSFGVARVESIVEVGKRVSSSGLSQRLGPALMSVDAASS